MDNFQCIYKILHVLEASLDYPQFDVTQIDHEALGISKRRWSKYMEMLVDNGYVKGVMIETYIHGDMSIDMRNATITLKGMEYLAENSIMQRIYRTAKGIKDVIPGM